MIGWSAGQLVLPHPFVVAFLPFLSFLQLYQVDAGRHPYYLRTLARILLSQIKDLDWNEGRHEAMRGLLDVSHNVVGDMGHAVSSTLKETGTSH
jgi:hypothetical protein